ncbi:uncharacterized protein LOC111081497 [Drosophila obscura]|uniref:uncharacterized protein LOC111081497 n=1 Tax=Drosophila obscura TaxID=7282 RepID=UPI000B9FD8C3|nr:uncharacterized protein LOC111081497 [Drosophila obscura]
MKTRIIYLLGAFAMVMGMVSASPYDILDEPSNLDRKINLSNPRDYLDIKVRIDNAKKAIRNLQPELKKYVALSQQIQLDQEKVDKEIANNKLALEIASKKLGDIHEKILDARQECSPQHQTNEEINSGDFDPEYTRVPLKPIWKPNGGMDPGFNRNGRNANGSNE